MGSLVPASAKYCVSLSLGTTLPSTTTLACKRGGNHTLIKASGLLPVCIDCAVSHTDLLGYICSASDSSWTNRDYVLPANSKATHISLFLPSSHLSLADTDPPHVLFRETPVRTHMASSKREGGAES